MHGDSLCSNSCSICSTCASKSTPCPASSVCGLQEINGEVGSLTLGPALLPGTMCTWTIDLRRNSTSVSEWTVQVNLDSSSAGKLILLAYQLPGNFSTESKSYTKSVFESPVAGLNIKANFLQISFSTGTKLATYTGFLLTWQQINDGSSNDFLAKVVSIIAVTLLIIICCGCCAICFYKLFHSLRAGNRYVLPTRVTPAQRYDQIQRDQTVIILSEENLESLLPKGKYKQELLEVGEAVCTICLEEFRQGCEVRKLPCKHLFHARCIEDWLGAQGGLPNCPMCKRNPFETLMHSRSNSQLLRSEIDLA